MSHSRNALPAVVLSLLLSGLGHLYAGRPKLARNRFVLALGTAMLGQTLLFTNLLGRATLPVAILLALAVYLWIAFDAGQTAKRAPSDYCLYRYNRWYVYAALLAAAAALLELESAAARVFIEAYPIQSGAMEPTLMIGDFIFVSKRFGGLANLQHESIIVYELPEEPGIAIIKRVSGLPGDTLSMSGNVLYRNGAAVDEPYLIRAEPGRDSTDPRMRLRQLRHYVGEDRVGYYPSLKNWGPLLVPPDSVFVLGDNRDNSYDTRYHGLVAGDRIKGQPAHVYYSYDKNGLMPLQFITAIRWERMGRRVN